MMDVKTPKVYNHGDLRVWWVPQIGHCHAFEVDVPSLEVGVLLLKTLALYDQFQLENRIKGDYANSGGLQEFVVGEPDCPEGEWMGWVDEESGEDDPIRFLEGGKKPWED